MTIHRMKLVPALIVGMLAAVALAACSSGSKAVPAGTSAPSAASAIQPASSLPPTSASAGTLTAQGLATAAGCAQVTPASKAGAATSVTCILGGKNVEVVTFASNAARDAYVKVGKSVYPNAGIREGDLWEVDSTEATSTDLMSFGGSAS